MTLIRTTVELEEDARKLARSLVEKQLACCVHVNKIESTYRWKGQIESAGEWLVEARAPAAKEEACWLAMGKNHPYEVPLVEIVANTRVNGAYARWVEEVMQ